MSTPTWDEQMLARSPAPPPQQELLRVCFRMVGPSRRPLRCAVFQVVTGHELRLEYEDREDLLRSQLFPRPDDILIDELAVTWRQALVDKGFSDIATIARS